MRLVAVAIFLFNFITYLNVNYISLCVIAVPLPCRHSYDYHYSKEVVKYSGFRQNYVQDTFRSVERIYIVDIVAYSNGTMIDVCLVMNIRFIPNATSMSDKSAIMLYKSDKYPNLNGFLGKHKAFVPHFQIPSSESQLKFSIMDKAYNWSFSNIVVKVEASLKPKNEIAVCLYVTSYDLVSEIQRFIAYYETVGIHSFIVYLMTDYPEFEIAFAPLIRSGHIIVNRLILPRVDGRTPNQGVQMNSCYYRYRQYFKYIFLCDIDEFLVSRVYPFDIYKAVEAAFSSYPGINTFQIKSTFYIQTRNDGEFFFDNYQCVIPVERGRHKNLIRYDFLGIIGVHISDNGNRMELSNSSLLEIAHYRRNLKRQCNTTESFMSSFSFPVAQMLRVLFHGVD